MADRIIFFIIFLLIFNTVFISIYTLVFKRFFSYFNKKVKKRWIILSIFSFLLCFVLIRIFIAVASGLSAQILLWITILLNYILGFLAIILFYVLCFELVSLFQYGINKILKKQKKSTKSNQQKIGILIIFLCIVTFIYGVFSFYDMEVTRYRIKTDKVQNNYKFLHITDTQYGSLTQKDLDKISTLVEEILKKETIDFILFTGDAVDTHAFTEKTFAKFDFKIPQFFTLGNHEFYHDLEKILKVMKQQNYQILRNENIFFKELNIVGIDDANDKKQVFNVLQTNKNLVVKDKYNILGYHRPVGALDAKKSGIDFMLAGHTHGGQMFPFSLILKLIYPYSQGLVDLKDFYLFTSDGIGLWGPKLRILTKSEITVFEITPEI